jgi:predicted N-acyltransferase
VKKLVFLFGLVLILTSCQKKEVHFSQEMIEKLGVVDDKSPSIYSSFDLYVMVNDSLILQRSINDLFRYYKQNYTREFKSFNAFIDEVLNNNFKINQKASFLDGFTLNQKIQKEYIELGFDNFFKKYSKISSRKDSNLELNKTFLQEEEYLAVVFLLYKNEYDIVKDCSLGIDYIVERETIFK